MTSISHERVWLRSAPLHILVLPCAARKRLCVTFCVTHARAQCVPPLRCLHFTACRARRGCSEPCMCPVVSVPPSKLACMPYVCGPPHM
eukprot:2118824-Pleurochrysis_carterae.AAC.1